MAIPPPIGGKDYLDQLSKVSIALENIMYIIKPATLTNLIYDLIVSKTASRRITIIASFLECYPVLKVLRTHIPDIIEWVEVFIEGYAIMKVRDETDFPQPIKQQAGDSASARFATSNPFTLMAVGGVGIIGTIIAGSLFKQSATASSLIRNTKDLAQTITSLGGVFKLVKEAALSVCDDLGMIPPSPEHALLTQKLCIMAGLSPRLAEYNEHLKRDFSQYFDRSSLFCSLYKTCWDLEQECLELKITSQSFRDKFRVFTTEWHTYRDLIRTVTQSISTRPRPVVIWLFGEPGHGKSTLGNFIVDELSKLEKRALPTYTFNSGDKYMSMYCGQDVFIFDDFGATVDAEECIVFPQLVGEQVYRCNMASLEEKGRLFSSKYIIVNSNLEAYTPRSLVNTPAAQHRRRDFVVRVEDRDILLKQPLTRKHNSDAHLKLTLRTPTGAPIQPERRIGRVEYNFQDIRTVSGRVELAQMMFNQSGVYKTEYALGAAKLNAGITMPDVPLPLISDEVDDSTFDEENWGGDEDDVDDDTETTASTISSESLETAKFPIRMLFGPPGTGKTTMLSQLGEISTLENAFLAEKTAVVLLNDVSVCVDTTHIFCGLVMSAYDNGPSIIATANPKMFQSNLTRAANLSFPNDPTAAKEYIHAVNRRLDVLSFSFARRTVLHHYTTADIPVYGPDKCIVIERSESSLRFQNNPSTILALLKHEIGRVAVQPIFSEKEFKVPDVTFDPIYFAMSLHDLLKHTTPNIPHETMISRAKLAKFLIRFKAVISGIDFNAPPPVLERRMNSTGIRSDGLHLPIVLICFDLNVFIWSFEGFVVCRVLKNFAGNDPLKFSGHKVSSAATKGDIHWVPTKRLSEEKIDELLSDVVENHSHKGTINALGVILSLAQSMMSFVGTACGVYDITVAMHQKTKPILKQKNVRFADAEQQGWADYQPDGNDAYQHEYTRYVANTVDGIKNAATKKTFRASASAQSESPTQSGFDAITQLQTKNHFLEAAGVKVLESECLSDSFIECSHRSNVDIVRQTFKYYVMCAYGFEVQNPPWDKKTELRFSAIFAAKIQPKCELSKEALYDSLVLAYWRFVCYKYSVCNVDRLEKVTIHSEFTPFDTPAFSLLNHIIGLAYYQTIAEKDPIVEKLISSGKIVNQSGENESVAIRLVIKNLKRVVAYQTSPTHGTTTRKQWALGLFGNFYLTCSHIFQPNTTVYLEVDGVKHDCRVVFESDSSLDFSIICCESLPSVRDIMSHWAPPEVVASMGDTVGCFVTIRDGNPFVQSVRFGDNGILQHGECSGRDVRIVTPNFVYVRKFLSEKGDCGCPYFSVFQGTARVVGIHGAGASNCGYVSCITKPMILSALNVPFTSPLPITPQGSIKVVVNNAADVILPINVLPYQQARIHSDSVFGQPCGEMLTAVGTKWEPHFPTKTQLHRTPMWCPEAGEPAILSVSDPRNPDGIDPFSAGMTKWLAPAVMLSPQLISDLNCAFDYIYSSLAGRLSISSPCIRKLTNIEAINYPSDIPGINSIDIESSSGLPWKMDPIMSGKKPLVVRDQINQIWVPSTTPMGQRFILAVEQLSTACFEQKKTACVFDATLKDEVLPIEKVDAVRTRIILGAPFDLTVVHRKYLATIGKAITDLHNDIPVKVGINQYTEWDILFKRFHVMGFEGMDADFKNWDTTVPSYCIRQCGELYMRLAQLFGMDERSQIIIRGIYLQIANPLICFKGLLYLCGKGLPSGQPFTAIDNSVINWALTFVAWKRACEGNLSSPSIEFEKHIELAVYGDDSAMAVSQIAKQFFTIADLQRVAEQMGMLVTSAQKSEKVSGYIHIFQLSFLSRTFNIDPKSYCGHIVGRLKPHSLYKMVGFLNLTKRHFYRRNNSDVCIDRAKIEELLLCSQLEAALCGQKAFEGFCQSIRKSLSDHGLVFQLASFGEIISSIYN